MDPPCIEVDTTFHFGSNYPNIRSVSTNKAYNRPFAHFRL